MLDFFFFFFFEMSICPFSPYIKYRNSLGFSSHNLFNSIKINNTLYII